MKKIAKALAVCAGLFAAFPLAADTETVGGYRWTYYIHGDTAEIGAISPNPTGTVTIPSTLGGKPVTSIGTYAFEYCSGLTSVTIPDSVTSIGRSAFSGCSGLTSVTIPDSVTSIGSSAFKYCSCLTSIVIPDSVTSIGDYVFEYCSGLTSMTIPDSVTSIGRFAFSGCSGLTSVSIPDSVTSIGGGAFSGCNESLYDTTTIPGVKLVDGWAIGRTDTLSGVLGLTGVRGIGDGAFRGCSGLTSVMIGNGVTSIGSDAFYDCSGLTSVSIGNGVTNIGHSAFSNCSGLMSVIIPNSVSSIGAEAFYLCKALVAFEVAEGNAYYKSVDGLLLTSDGKTLVAGVNGDVVIPNSVTSIGDNAFRNCGGLTSVIIPDSVTSIGNNAFWSCTGLTNVTIPGSVTNFGYNAFFSCNGLTNVTIGNGVTSIGGSAFSHCTNLCDITIPNSVYRIGSNAFDYCTKLDTNTIAGVVLADGWAVGHTSDEFNIITDDHGFRYKELDLSSVKGIADGAFSGCSQLQYQGNDGSDTWDIPRIVKLGSYVRRIGAGAFGGCNLTDFNLDGLHIGSIGEEAFRDCYVFAYDGLANIGSIEDGAFRGCYGLEDDNGFVVVKGVLHDYHPRSSGAIHVNIPESVTRIGPYSLSDGYWNYDSYSITSVSIPDSVTSIADNAFGYCSCLTSVTIGNGVTCIGDWAFSGCSGLTSVTIPYSVTSIGDYAFSGCSGLTSVTIGDGVTSIGGSAFSGCSGLTSVTIPNSVTSIGDYAFEGCSGLTNVTFIGNAPEYAVDRVFADVNPDCILQVEYGSTGWGVDIPGTWSGMNIRYKNVTVVFSLGEIGICTGGGALVQDVEVHSSATPPEVKAVNGWRFLGWDRPFDSVTEDVTVNAVYQKLSFSSINLAPGQGVFVYDGTAKRPAFVIVDGTTGEALSEGVEYTLEYNANVEPGTASVVAVGINEYSGVSIEGSFEILPASFGLAADGETGGFGGETGSIAGYEGEYDGEGHGVTASVSGVGEVSIRYATNENGPYSESLLFTNVCDETVWVELSAPGYNSFTGAVKVVITPRSIENATVAARNIVEGPGRQPVFSLDVQDDGIGRTLVDGTDYCANVVNDDTSGMTTVTVTGIGNYTGERVVETAYVKTRNIGGVDWQYWPAGDRAWLVSAKQSSEEMPSVVVIPDELDGLPVREVPDGFFVGCKSIETVVVGANVAKFGDSVFDGCTALKHIVFAGDAPVANRYVFAGAPSDVQIVVSKKDGGWGEAWPAGDEARQVMPAPTVGITPFSGKKSGRMAVTMTHDCEIPEAVVRYTIDGTEPTATSTFYEKRFSINVTGLVSVKAAVFLGGVRISDVSETRYSPVLNDVLNIGDIIAKPGSAPLFFDLDSSNQWWSDETETSFDGTPSMKSGRIGNDSSSWMSATFTGAGVLEFSWKASCEEDNLGEFFYDHAVCELDGVEVAWIDGDSGKWERVEIAVETAGEHTVKWIYMKDAADDTVYPGADCVWVDGVKFSYPVYISFAAGDGTGEPPEPLMGAIGYEVKLPGQGGLTCAKHRFAGWSDGERVYGAGEPYAVGGADATLTAAWTEKVLDAPVIEVPETYDEESTTVAIAAASGAAIYYTTDGSEPGAGNGILYEGAFRVSGTTTIRAIAVADDWFDSAVAEARTARSWTSLEECLGAAGFALATGGGANWIGDAREGCVKTAAHAGGWLTATFEGPGVATYLSKEGDGEWTRRDEVFPGGGEHVLRWEGESLMLKNLELLPVVSVSFAAGDDVSGDAPPTIYTAEGRRVEIPGGDGFARPKHEFAGWSAGGDVLHGGDSWIAGGADATLTAVWTEKRLSAPAIDAPAVYEADCATVTIAAGDGAAVFYTTDGTEPSADNPASLLYQGPFAIEGSATIKAVATKEDWFDSVVVSSTSTRLPWTFGECLNWPGQDFATNGDAAWERVKSASADGFALASGKIGNKQKSRLSTTVQGEGVISFLMKVSSEADAETGEAYDGLAFSVDGSDAMDLAGGELDWRRMTFRVEGEGPHVLEWRYEKDKRDSSGADCAWLDEVSWTPKGSVPHVEVLHGKGEIAKTGSGYVATANGGATLTEDDFAFGSVPKEAYKIEIAADGKSATVVLAPPRIASAAEAGLAKDPGDPAGVLVAAAEDAIAAKPVPGSGEKIGALPVKTHPGLFYRASWGGDPRNLVSGEKVPGTGGVVLLGVTKQAGGRGFYGVSASE